MMINFCKSWRELGEMSLALETGHYINATELRSSLQQQLIASERIFTEREGTQSICKR